MADNEGRETRELEREKVEDKRESDETARENSETERENQGNSRLGGIKNRAKEAYNRAKDKIQTGHDVDDPGGQARGRGNSPMWVPPTILERPSSGNFWIWVLVVAVLYWLAYHYFLPFKQAMDGLKETLGISGFTLLVGIIWLSFIFYGFFSASSKDKSPEVKQANFWVALVLLVWFMDMLPANFFLAKWLGLTTPYAGFEFDWKNFPFETTFLAIITSAVTFAILYVSMVWDIIRKDKIQFILAFAFIIITNKILANFIPSSLKVPYPFFSLNVLLWVFVAAVLIILAVWWSYKSGIGAAQSIESFGARLFSFFIFSFFFINNGWTDNIRAIYHMIFILGFGFGYLKPHEKEDSILYHLGIALLMILDFYGYGLLYSTDILFVQFIPILVIVVLFYCYNHTHSTYALVCFIFLVTVILILSLSAVNAYQTGSIQFQARTGNTFSTFISTLTKQTTSLLEGQLEQATGGLYRSRVELNQYEPLGVYLTDIRASQPRYRSDEPVTIWGKINAKTLSDPIIINFNCYRFEGKDEDKEKIPIKTDGLYPNRPFSVFTYEQKDTECNFNNEESQIELKPGSNEVSLAATYNFDTSAYHKVYFIDKARQRSMVTEGLDPLKEFGINERTPVTVYTNGPVELAVSIPNIVTVSADDELAPVIGILLKNRDRINNKAGEPIGQWEGKIKDIRELVLVLPKGVSLKKAEKDQKYDCKPSPFKEYTLVDCKQYCGTYITEPCIRICNGNQQCIERDCHPPIKRCADECDDLFRVDSAGGAELKGYQLDIESIKSEFKSDDLRDIDKFRTFGCRLSIDEKLVLENTPITTRFIRLKARYNYTVEKTFNINVDSIKTDDSGQEGLIPVDGSKINPYEASEVLSVSKEEFLKANYYTNNQLELEYGEIVYDISSQYKVDPIFVKSLIIQESGLNRKAVSEKNARGIAQVIPATAQRMGCASDYDTNARSGIECGIKYIAYLTGVSHKNGLPLNWHNIAAGYHCGERALSKDSAGTLFYLRPGNCVDKTSTFTITSKQYADSVMSRYQKLKARMTA